MLGKAEYVKFTLRSICEERIKHFLSNKILSASNLSIETLKSSNTISFLNDNVWYEEFLATIPKEYESLYRYAAFVSDNIGNLKKDKFDIKKSDGTALSQAEEFSIKGVLSVFREEPGEWHLQKIFVQEVEKLKDSV